MMNGRRVLVGLVRLAATLAILLSTTEARAFETDQFLAMTVELEDSAAVINEYLNSELVAFLERPGLAKRSCQVVPQRFFRHLFQGLLASRLQKFLKSDDRVDLFPKDWSYGEYLRRSVYRKPWFPFVLPLSPTIQVGEVRFGLDKFGHVFGFGRRYYKRYLRHLRQGDPADEAIRRVVRRGIRLERLILGGIADGVFSHSDLEANYQGLELSRSFCEGPNPRIQRVNGKWRLLRPIDLTEVVTPSFDESFETNHYPKPRWKRVRPIIEAEHCETYNSAAVQGRMQRYRALESSNVSQEIITEYFEKQGRDFHAEQSMEAVCGPPTANSAQSDLVN